MASLYFSQKILPIFPSERLVYLFQWECFQCYYPVKNGVQILSVLVEYCACLQCAIAEIDVSQRDIEKHNKLIFLFFVCYKSRGTLCRIVTHNAAMHATIDSLKQDHSFTEVEVHHSFPFRKVEIILLPRIIIIYVNQRLNFTLNYFSHQTIPNSNITSGIHEPFFRMNDRNINGV